MSISHVQHLLPLLLASLFLIPASYAVEFQNCGESGNDYAFVRSVDVFPDPVGSGIKPTIEIRAIANKFISSSVEVSVKSVSTGDTLNTYKLCAVTESCNIEPNNNFLLILSDVGSAGDDHKYAVSLTDFVAGELLEIMCITFTLPTSDAIKMVTA